MRVVPAPSGLTTDERPTQGLDAVDETTEPGRLVLALDAGAADAVVANRHRERRAVVHHTQPRLRRTRVLDGVRDRLRADVVRRRLERGRQPPRQDQVELDRQRGARRAGPNRRGQPLAGEKRRIEPAGELPEIGDGALEVREGVRRTRPERGVVRDFARHRAEAEQRCGQALLRAVVEVALEPTPFLVSRLEDAQA